MIDYRRPGTRFIALLILGALALSGCGEAPSGAVTVSPDRFDFGKVRHGVTRHQTFTITNHSDRAVTVTKAAANCACFEVSKPPRPRLAAGESTDFEIEFASYQVPPQRLRGKHLEILTDHPDSPITTIPLEGTIFSPYYTDPRDAVLFGMVTGRPENYAPRTVKLRAEDGYEIALLTDLEGWPGGIRVSHPELFDVRSEAVERGIDIVITLKKDGPAPRGRLGGGALNVALSATGPKLGDEPLYKAFRLEATWPTASVPPTPPTKKKP